jgi:hypothetical protein
MDWTKYPVPHPQVAARVVDGTAVIVLASSGEVVMLNAIGSRIWELLDGARTAQDIVHTIVSEYDVTEQQARQDVEEFLQKLMQANALVLNNRPTLT